MQLPCHFRRILILRPRRTAVHTVRMDAALNFIDCFVGFRGGLRAPYVPVAFLSGALFCRLDKKDLALDSTDATSRAAVPGSQHSMLRNLLSLPINFTTK